MVKKVLMILFIAWFASVLFMPKRNLYYKLEETLAVQGVKINEGKIIEGLFILEIEDAVIYVKGIDLIHVKALSFFSLFFYSRLELKEIILDESLSSMAPTKLEEITFSHFLWSPEHLSVSGRGEFGTFEGDIDLIQRKVHLDLIETAELGAVKRLLKEGEKGLYYETSF